MDLVPKIWDEATCFIIGGGPSVASADLPLARLQGKHVIACNAAFKIAPWADICWFGDGRFHDWNVRELAKFGGLKMTCDFRPKWSPGILPIKRDPVLYGISTDPKRIRWNHNTGGSAINLAVLLGATRIVLLGYDMKVAAPGKHNWHDFHKHTPPDTIYQNRFLLAFPHIKQGLDEIGVECYNVNPDSALTEFPFVDFDETLEW